MHTRRLLLFLLLLCPFMSWAAPAGGIFIETESFEDKGGWVLDQQFMDVMGSPYLLAHGLGVPVADAATEFYAERPGQYHIYVRTYNWTAPWHDGKGPGSFMVGINGKPLGNEVGCTGDSWNWQYAGSSDLKTGKNTISLIDLTGFDGRCDAIYITRDKGILPPDDTESLERFRRKTLGLGKAEKIREDFDLVVAGGGIAGMSAAISAARLGCKVALINDRPVLGGNNSSEIRVHLGGRISIGEYQKLGDLQKEFGPEKGGNAMPASYYEDDKKMDAVLAENNITLFLNYRVISLKKSGDRIKSITARHIENGNDIEISGELFSDCTGDGTLGYLAGAEFRMGRESRSEFGEPSAPEKADNMVMGASVQWYAVEKDKEVKFPEFKYGINFSENSCAKRIKGDWDWETGMLYDQMEDAERIRDYGLLVVYSNWSYIKNESVPSTIEKFSNKKLEWVAYIAGKRESRRIVGDYILREKDLVDRIIYDDATACTTWSIDLHYPHPENTKFFEGEEFRSKAVHKPIHPYPIPYRCLYSKDISNMFMAGRNISVTHVALGTVRVMRTTGMMGEVVGMATSLCRKYNVMPRDIYTGHLDELKELMSAGIGRGELPDNQNYNLGQSLAFPKNE